MNGETINFLDPHVLIPTVIFLLAYVMIIIDKIDRTLVAMSGAILVILFKTFQQEDAFASVDYGTLGLLISMMIIVMVTKRSGIFQYIAIKTAKIAKGEPLRILIYLAVVTGILSAFLDNVTTILLILPVTFTITETLMINPIPFIMAEVFASNVGGTATLIGDPPNIMIGSDVDINFSFMDFITNATPIILPILMCSILIFAFIFRKKMDATPEAKASIMSMNENACIKDKDLLIKCLLILGVTVIGFIFHATIGYHSATIAIAGAVAILLITGVSGEEILKEVEWKTIFFFVGLFIMVGAVESAGVLEFIAQSIKHATGGNIALTSIAVLWISAIASAFIDNIPFVATMLPVIKDMNLANPNPVWWALSLGSCLGGNGTIIGASANVVATGMSEKNGHKITFGAWFKLAFPIMLLTIGISTIYIYLRYLL